MKKKGKKNIRRLYTIVYFFQNRSSNNFLYLSTKYYYFTRKVLFQRFLFDSERKFLLLSVAFSLIFLQ